MKTEKRNRNPLTIALSDMDVAVTKQQWSFQGKLPRLKSAWTLILIALLIALVSCDNGKNDPAEEHEYRTDPITFAFKDGEGNPLDGTYKATVQGAMLLADWNNAKTTIKTKIENA